MKVPLRPSPPPKSPFPRVQLSHSYYLKSIFNSFKQNNPLFPRLPACHHDFSYLYPDRLSHSPPDSGLSHSPIPQVRWMGYHVPNMKPGNQRDVRWIEVKFHSTLLLDFNLPLITDNSVFQRVFVASLLSS